ncbi:hypothetical protein NL676_027204 [Syzygium grande]|nr:hypothetical protein NL676_027204 [Syzygium grande]
MAAPVARSLLINRHASLRFIRASLLRRSNTATVKDQSLLAPSGGGGGGGGIVLGQCQFQNPSCAHLNRQVAVSAPHSLGRSSLLVGGEDRRGSGREYRLAAEDELEMRRRKEVSDEDEEDDSGMEDGGFDSDDAGRWGDFDTADFDDGDDDDDDDDEDDAHVDAPRKRRK